VAFPAGAALVAARLPDTMEGLPEWRASTVFATIKKIAAKTSGKDRFMPRLTYNATQPPVIVVGVVPDAVSILGVGYWEGSTRRRRGYGGNHTIPSSNRRRSERAPFLQIPGSHKPNSPSMAAIAAFLVRTVQSMQHGAAGRTT
jgi:hypothetical protein